MGTCLHYTKLEQLTTELCYPQDRAVVCLRGLPLNPMLARSGISSCKLETSSFYRMKLDG
jgi:hypothetical protein